MIYAQKHVIPVNFDYRDDYLIVNDDALFLTSRDDLHEFITVRLICRI